MKFLVKLLEEKKNKTMNTSRTKSISVCDVLRWFELKAVKCLVYPKENKEGKAT